MFFRQAALADNLLSIHVPLKKVVMLLRASALVHVALGASKVLMVRVRLAYYVTRLNCLTHLLMLDTSFSHILFSFVSCKIMIDIYVDVVVIDEVVVHSVFFGRILHLVRFGYLRTLDSIRCRAFPLRRLVELAQIDCISILLVGVDEFLLRGHLEHVVFHLLRVQ